MDIASNEYGTKTSEAVSTGHPDKIADQIADSVFDHLRTQKTNPQSAIEVSLSANNLFVFGEIDRDLSQSHGGRTISTSLQRDIEEIALNTIREIGYTPNQYNPYPIVDVVSQSAEINKSVEKAETGAGDQGIVSGYATSETRQGLPLHYLISQEILKTLEHLRTTGIAPWLYPDAKSQVTIGYGTDGIHHHRYTPKTINHVLVSQSHSPDISLTAVQDTVESAARDTIHRVLENQVIFPHVKEWLRESLNYTKFVINPTGAWHDCGPAYDSGLTGRKLVVDNYGSGAPIGGGSTSGKNLSKVDRSGAYYARLIAKSLISQGLGYDSHVELGYTIGETVPTSISIKASETKYVSISRIRSRIHDTFEFTVDDAIQRFSSLNKFARASRHGNYTDNTFPWEIPVPFVK